MRHSINTNLGLDFLILHNKITLVDRITKSLDNGNIAVAILLDLKKAFDTVDHKILLKKLDMLTVLVASF